MPNSYHFIISTYRGGGLTLPALAASSALDIANKKVIGESEDDFEIEWWCSAVGFSEMAGAATSIALNSYR